MIHSKLIEKQANDGNIAVKSNIIPQTLRGFFDPDRINQVLLNLYLNAMEAMETGGAPDSNRKIFLWTTRCFLSE